MDKMQESLGGVKLLVCSQPAKEAKEGKGTPRCACIQRWSCGGSVHEAFARCRRVKDPCYAEGEVTFDAIKRQR